MSSEEVKLSSDVVIKQEYVAAESSEKNSTTQLPATEPRKPAQEQTRTENLQRIQQRKLKVIYLECDLNIWNWFWFHSIFSKIYKLPKPQKMAKLSMYSACQKCRCMGWKTQEENRHDRHRDVESNYCPKFNEECRNAGCKHPLGEFIFYIKRPMWS